MILDSFTTTKKQQIKQSKKKEKTTQTTAKKNKTKKDEKQKQKQKTKQETSILYKTQMLKIPWLKVMETWTPVSIRHIYKTTFINTSRNIIVFC